MCFGNQLAVGVIGAEHFAEKRLEVLVAFPDVKVTAICNRRNPTIRNLAERFQIPNVHHGHRYALTS